MADLSNSGNVDLPPDTLELAGRRAAALGLSLGDYIDKLVIADVLRVNASNVQTGEVEHVRLLKNIESSRPVSDRIKLAVLNLDRNGF